MSAIFARGGVKPLLRHLGRNVNARTHHIQKKEHTTFTPHTRIMSFNIKKNNINLKRDCH